MSPSTQKGDSVPGSTENQRKSELHWLFAEPRCKMTLKAVDKLTLPADLDTVATAVTKMESQGETIDQNDVNEIAVSLHHTHLPKMDRLGVIGYDSERKLIG